MTDTSANGTRTYALYPSGRACPLRITPLKLYPVVEDFGPTFWIIDDDGGPLICLWAKGEESGVSSIEPFGGFWKRITISNEDSNHAST